MSSAKSHILQHEENKKYLRNQNFKTIRSNLQGRRVRVVNKYKDDLLIELTIGPRHNNSTYKYLRVKDTSTGKLVFLSVPPHMNNCKEAIAWTFDLSLSEYELLFET